MTITLDTKHAEAFCDVASVRDEAAQAVETLESRSGAGTDFLGWLDLPEAYDREEYARIQAAAAKIQDMADALIVVGIGGSYLGARATIEALTHPFHNALPGTKRATPAIYYAGINMSSDYLQGLLDLIEQKDVCINVISKSGTTTEPAIAFRVLREALEQKYGAEAARERIFATTDRAKGALKNLAIEEGYETFVVPDDVGGRYSVLTAVGLLPIAVAGVDIDALMEGARHAMDAFAQPLGDNPCYEYAAVRNALYRSGYKVELLAHYEPGLHYVAEWWKQLFGESEGKENKGIFPSSVNFTADLHSMGQYIQQGERHLFATTLSVAQPWHSVAIPTDEKDYDDLNYLTDRTLHDVNTTAKEAVVAAHTEGGVPNVVITLPERSAFVLGQLFYFFEKACAVSGYMLGVNPFDQPGVESYKAKMFEMLGKPEV